MHNWPLYDFKKDSYFAKNDNQMSLKTNFGITVRILRKEQGVSQEQFAVRAGIDRRYMSDIETGKRNISFDIIERIAKGFGLSVSELMLRAEQSDHSALSLKELKEWLCENFHEDTAVLESEDFIPAIIGISEDERLVYSHELMVKQLMRNQGMDYEEAVDFISYDIIRMLPYAGEYAPIIMYDIE